MKNTIAQSKQAITLIYFFYFLFLFAEAGLAQGPAVKPGEWPDLSNTTKPWTRWWWMGNAVDKKNLKYLLEEYKSAGLGGLEIAPIYGAKGHEDRYLEYLSSDWLEMLHYTIEVADSLGLGIDLTQGTGWPFGGPMVGPESAAKKLISQAHYWKAGEGLDRPILLEDKKEGQLDHCLVTVMAFPAGEGKEAMEISDRISATGALQGDLEGDWKIFALFQAQTGQMVKRAAPGGKGFTLDHFDVSAVEGYLSHFETAFGQDFPGIRAFYNDSFEVYGADFTPGFFKYFQENRGYDLKRHLPDLLSDEPDESSTRLKSDYRETINEMLLEHFTEQWTNWAHSHGKKTKNQAHGSPGNLLDLYATVDIPEGETFGSSYFPIPGIRRDSADIRNVDPDPIMLKFASSAAHLIGNNLASTETFTWLGEHFKSSFSQAKPELEQAFLAGINHMFYHGVTYSPEDVGFPGWLFYASLNLNTHNSLWPHFKGFNTYIQRAQSVLQAGNPDNELLVYWPVYDVWADSEGLSKMLTVHGIDEWLHPTPFYKESKSLMNRGYSLDFISDALLDDLDVEGNTLISGEGKNKSKVLIIPESEFMPLATLERILALAETGAQVVFQSKPKDVPGFLDVDSRKAAFDNTWGKIGFASTADPIAQVAYGKGKILLSPDLEKALSLLEIERETLVDGGLKFIRRDLNGEKLYFIVNHTAGRIDKKMEVKSRYQAAVLMNPQQGNRGLAAMDFDGEMPTVRVGLDPGEAMVLHLVDSKPMGLDDWIYESTALETITLTGPWKLEFKDGGPELPQSRNLEKLVPWTALGDEKANIFSGQGIYETTIDLSFSKDNKYILDLGKVLESARVWINDKEVGYAFGIPFKLDISGALKNGENKVKIEVANLMANRIRDLDLKGVEWRNYHEINFVNIDYGPFDASGWDIMPSGLAGPVSIKIYQ